MAVVWEKNRAGTQYEVRSAGNSIRLYTDKIFHSQWNPRCPIGGQLWELLFLPSMFLHGSQTLNKVLVLGVGGGAVINLLQRYRAPEDIIGVELDKTHIQIAKRWFKAKGNNIHYVHGEAREWLEDYKGKGFDLIVEDLFISDGKGEPIRAIPASVDWLKLLKSKLLKKGMLVMNFETIRQARKAWREAVQPGGLQNGRLFTGQKYQNAIAAFSNERLSISELKSHLAQFPDLDIRKKSCKLDYKCKVLG